MTIMSKPPSKDYDDNFDRTFGKPEQLVCPLCQLPIEPPCLIFIANGTFHKSCYDACRDEK